jgi:hypothetical protein
MPLERRRSISEFMGRLTTMVAPVPRGIRRCLRRKRTFLWYRCLGKRHRYVNRRRGKRGRRNISFAKISRRSGTSTLSSLLSRTRRYILQRSDRPSLHLMLGRHGEYISY